MISNQTEFQYYIIDHAPHEPMDYCSAWVSSINTSAILEYQQSAYFIMFCAWAIFMLVKYKEKPSKYIIYLFVLAIISTCVWVLIKS